MKTVIFDNNKSTEYSNITHLINMGESIIPEASQDISCTDWRKH